MGAVLQRSGSKNRSRPTCPRRSRAATATPPSSPGCSPSGVVPPPTLHLRQNPVARNHRSTPPAWTPMAQHIYRDMLTSVLGRSSDGSVASRWTDPTPASYVVPPASIYQNPPVFFPGNPPSAANSAPNWDADDVTVGEESYAQQHFATNGGINSDAGHNSTAAMYDDDQEDDEISSQPLMPYVGMEFDSVDDAKTFYNEYAFKMGFGTRIGASKNSQKKGPPTLIKRVFQCVHAGKPESKGDGSSASEGLSMGGASSSSANWFEMDVTNKRQKNRLLRYDCKAHLIVGIRGNKWIASHLEEKFKRRKLT